MVDEAVAARISALARAWDCPATPEQVGGVAAFFELLLQWNAKVNLTGARDVAELVEEHLPDSFALAALVPRGAKVVDVGAGGGLPGIPFALLRPDCAVTLVEPRAKRTAFLSTAQRVLGLASRLAVVRGRDEDVPPGAFDVAASRATFAPEEWLSCGRRLLKTPGRVIVFAAAPVDGEPVGCAADDTRSYRTGRGAARWIGAFVPRGTSQAPG